MAVTENTSKSCKSGSCSEAPIPPCSNACPIDTNAPLYIRHISHGEYEKAWKVIIADNPFPMSCGLVCHHPCEIKCRAGEVGDPVAIRALKRFVAEKARDEKYGAEWVEPEPTGKRVAIIGAGPAGLTTGYYLRKKGHAVTILEASDKLGGMLNTAVPGYRLQKEDLEFDLENLKASGMEIKLNQVLGRDYSVKDLKNEYDAVLLAFGASHSLKLEIVGEDTHDVYPGLEFLQQAKSGERIEVKDSVIVIGGGNLALDVARTALRLGAKEVNLFCRRSYDEIRAHDWEITEAEEEGVVINPGWVPLKILDENGRKKIIFRKSSSVRKPRGDFKSDFYDSVTAEYTADQIFIAIGYFPPDVIGKDDLQVEIKRWGAVDADESSLATNIEGVFAAGDCVTGASSLVDAIAAGKLAAGSIDEFLQGGKPKKAGFGWLASPLGGKRELATTETMSLDRSPVKEIPPGERVSDFRKVEVRYSEEEALREANRCLACDLEPKEETRLRRFVQISTLLAFNSYWPGWYNTITNRQATIYQGQIKSVCYPGLHCYSCPGTVVSCPIGSIQFWLNNAKLNFSRGSFDLIGLYVIGFLGMIGAVFGRAACGWLCPFGLFQDVMYKIPTPFKLKIPKILKYFKYLVLFFAVFLLPLIIVDETGLGRGPWFCKTICPSGTLVAGIPLISADKDLQEQVHLYFPIKLTILILFIIWMVLAKRPFCRTTCPLGAFWSFFNRISILRVKVDETQCRDDEDQSGLRKWR